MIATAKQVMPAWLHWAQSGTPHLRAKQDFFIGDNFSDALKSVGSPYRWYGGLLEWDWPLTPAGVTTLTKVCEEFNVEVQWSDDLKQYAEEQLALDRYEERVRLAIEAARRNNTELPSYLTNDFSGQKPPKRHQILGYHWAQRASGLLFWWDPGTGKTRGGADAAGGWYRNGIIRTMSHIWLPDFRDEKGKIVYRARWGVEGGILVVCPKQVIRTWSRELQQWQGMTSVEVLGTRKAKDKKAGMLAHAHIVNYESLSVVLRNKYDAIIVDESHRCANNTIQTGNVLEIAVNCKRRLLLSGTPISNTLESVFYQKQIVDGGRALGPSHAAFIDRYFHSERNGPVQKNIARSGASDEIAKSIASCTFFVQKEDIDDWPEKVHTPIYLEMTLDQRRYYEALRDEAIAYIQDSEVTVEQASSRMMKLLQVCQGIIRDDQGVWREFNNIKMETTIDRLKNDLLGRKVIIWCRFTHEVTKLVERLQKEGIWSLRFDGKVKSQKIRNQIIDAWNTDPRYTAFVGQISMGEGIELLAEDCQLPCFETLYQGLDYRFVSWQQSQDRVHRLTQKYDCNYTYLLTDKGIDKNIYKALLAKESTSNTVKVTGKEYYLALLKDDVPNLEAL